MLAHEYGWSIEYIRTRTVREVNYLVSTISKRKNLEYKFQASIHGCELNIPTDETENDVPFTKETQDLIEKRKRETFEKIKRRAKNG